MSEHAYRKNEDELATVLWIIITFLSPVFLVLLLFLVAPNIKASFFSKVLGIKALEAKLVLEKGEHELLDDASKKYRVYSRSAKLAGKRAKTRDFISILKYGARSTNLKIGVVLTGLFFLLAGLSFWFFNRNENRDSPKKLKEKFYKKTLKDICKEFSLPYPLPKDPVKLAKMFSEVRKVRNVPPNLVARKLNDPVLAMAVSWYNRVVPPKELDMEPTIMVPIRDPREFEEYLQRVMKELNDEEKEKERIEKLQSLIEQIMQQQQQQQQRRGGFGGFGRF